MDYSTTAEHIKMDCFVGSLFSFHILLLCKYFFRWLQIQNSAENVENGGNLTVYANLICQITIIIDILADLHLYILNSFKIGDYFCEIFFLNFHFNYINRKRMKVNKIN